MKMVIEALICTLLAVPIAAGEPDPIRVPAPPTPEVTPVPLGTTIILPEEYVYVVDGDIEFLVFASPEGYLKITKEPGPMKFRGKFVGGKGVVETKTFNGKFLAFLEPLPGVNGDVEILIVPVGSKDESKTIRQKIKVKSGIAPQPPPDPKPPDPKPPEPPDPKPPTPVTSFQVIIVYESGATLTAAQNSVLYGKAVEDCMTSLCTGGKNGWGRRDKDTNPATDTTKLKDMWAAVKPVVTSTPCIAISVNNAVTLEPLPATPEATCTLLKKYHAGVK